MSEGVKTALIVVGVGLGAFLLVRTIGGTPSVRKPGTAGNPLQSQQGAMFLSGLVSGGLSSLFKAGAFSSTTPVTPFVAQPTVTQTTMTSSGDTVTLGTLTPGGSETVLPTADDPYLSGYNY
jgi:hypothetical protein